MSQLPRHSVSSADRISTRQLVAYGFGGLIPIALFNVAGQLMGLIGNIGLGLSAFWLGVVLIIPRLWDAISDPLVGHFSDNLRTRWGRRRPFLLVGGITVALSFVLMWWVPKGASVEAWFDSESAYQWFQLGYILFFLLIFFTACTVFEIPHGALGMEMSADPHERTKLFSAKSFCGNLFAMGTPWLLFLAGLEFFRGVGGTAVDGMRWVSMCIAVVLIPMSVWWFFACKEPAFSVAKIQKKNSFWHNMKASAKNPTFQRLVVIIFTLAMGFNFVNLFTYYITIFYLYGGDMQSATALLGITGTVWAITSLVAVFPLNWLGKRFGKKATLGMAMGLMCLSQLSKIVCYNPDSPYLVLIPAVLLASGMLMFFTLGSSMLGDICDEDDLQTGTRSEGSYYSVYWWFIKMGTAFASLVTGVLLTMTQFNETQSKSAAELYGSYELLLKDAKTWAEEGHEPEPESAKEHVELFLNDLFGKEKDLTLSTSIKERDEAFSKNVSETMTKLEEFESIVNEGGIESSSEDEHGEILRVSTDSLIIKTKELQSQSRELVGTPNELRKRVDQLMRNAARLSEQSPRTLLLLRVIEIGLPLILCVVSFWLLKFYPLTDKRSYEVKRLLEERNNQRKEE